MPIYDINGEPLTVDSNNYNYEKWSGKKFVLHGNSLTTWGSAFANFMGMSSYVRTDNGGSLTGNRNTTTEMKEFVESIYPDSADLIILQGDGNVMTDNYGNASDQLDGDSPQTTWCARVNYLVRCLKAKFPNAVIALMPDSVWYEGTPLSSWKTNKNRNNYNAMKAIADYNRTYFICVDADTPFDPTHGLTNYYTGYKVGTEQIDGVHPNAKYIEAKAKAVAHYVAGFIFDPDAPNNAVSGWQDNV